MSSCIYPGPHSTNMSDEHYLPAGLGEFRNCEPLRDRICVGCNKKLGDELETRFLRTGPVGLFRWILGLRGRKGTAPSPFFKGAGNAKAVVALGQVAGLPFPIALECGPGIGDAHPMRQIIMEHPLLGTRPFPIFDGTTEDSFVRQLDEEGFSTARPIHAFASADERPWLDTLARAAGAASRGSWTQTQLSSEAIRVETTATFIPHFFYREIAKIAFHYLLKVCPEFSGNEWEFKQIRDYIWSGSGGRPVHENPQQILVNFLRGERPTHWSHFLHVFRDHGYITGYVQLFVGPHALPRPYRVDIGRDPSMISTPMPRQYAHQFDVLDPAAPNNVVGEMVNVDPAEHIIPVVYNSRLVR